MIAGIGSTSLRALLYLSLLLPVGDIAAQGVGFDYKHPTVQSVFFDVSADSTDSGFVAAGTLPVFTLGLQGMVYKFNKSGQTVWARTFGGAQHENVKAVAATSDHGAVVTGSMVHPHDGSTNDIFLTKYDAAGNQEWFNYISATPGCESYAVDIQETPDGGYVIAGYIYCSDFVVVPNISNQDYCVIKTDAGGNVQWTQIWSDSDYDLLSCIKVRFDGGLVVCGLDSDDEGVNNAAYVAGLSSGGGVEWEYSGAIGDFNSAKSVSELPDGGYIVAAETDGSGNTDAQLIRLDDAGSHMWTQTYLLTGTQLSVDVEVLCDGGFALVGTDYSDPAKGADCYVLRAAPDGAEIWRQGYGLSNGDYVKGAARVPGGGIAIAAMRDYVFQPPNNTYYGWVFKITDGARRFTIKDGDELPLSRKAVEFRRLLSGSPDWQDELVYFDSTDEEGHVCPCDTLFGADAQFKVRKLLHSEPSIRHGAEMPTKYSVTSDNMKIDELGAIRFDTLADLREQDIVLDHTTIGINLVASIEWDTRDGYRNSLQDGFRSMANYLYDVYNGQLTIDTVVIFDNKLLWDDADIQIFASNMQWPRATPTGFDDPNFASIKLPRQFYGTADATRNKTFTIYPYVLTNPTHFRTLGHELGHYLFGFEDEYEIVGSDPRCSDVVNYGYMDAQFENREPMASELSSSLQYANAACQNNLQYTRHSASCWDQFESQFQKTFGKDTVFAAIIKPTERTLQGSDQYAAGPNDYLPSPDYNVGALVVFPEPDFEASTPNKIVTTYYRHTSTILRKVNVELRKASGEVIQQGQSSDAGKIRVFDVSVGDKIRASGSARAHVANPSPNRGVQEEWLYGEALSKGAGKSGLGNYYEALAGDSIALELNAVQGSHNFIVDMSLSSGGAECRLYVDNLFAETPSVEHLTASGSGGTSSFQAAGNMYKADISGELSSEGSLTVSAIDDSGASFSVATDYATSVPIAGEQLFATDGSAFFLPGVSVPAVEKAALVTSSYPILRNGLTDENVQAGKTASLALYPTATWSGDTRLTIRYQDSDLELPARIVGDETSLRIFIWNQNESLWNLVGGSVDTTFNEVTAEITAAGVYAAFTTATQSSAPCGDADGSGQPDIADAVYMINYMFGTGTPPLDASGGDVDCSGEFDIADIVYLIRYIFVIDAPAPCALCQ